MLAALGGFYSRAASAAGPLPACPAGGPAHLESAHFTIDYTGDIGTSDYITETQAGDILAAAERAYDAFGAIGYPTPLVNGSGKTGISVVDLTAAGVSSLYCSGDFDFDSADVGKEDMAYNVGWDVFAQIELKVAPTLTFGSFWLIQAAASWASWKALGYPAASGTHLGPFEMSLDCWDAAQTQKCSKDGYENLGGSRWAFYEYLDERFGDAFLIQLIAAAETAGDAMTGLQNALAAEGTSVSAEYAAFTTKLMQGGWSAASLNIGTPPLSGAPIHAGAATGDTAPQTFGVDHLATRYIEIDRGDGDASHPCYAATLTITVQIPAGVTSQPVFWWNASGTSPVALTVNGQTATASVPWDTCVWQNKGYLSLPNTSLTANGNNFVVSTHLAVDTNLPATSTPPPAPTSVYGPTVDVASNVAPEISLFGPELIHLSAAATQLRLIVESNAEGSVTARLGSLLLGTSRLRPGGNDLRFTLPAGTLKRLRTMSATNALTLTPTSADGSTTGAVITREVAVAPATKKNAAPHRKAAPKKEAAPKSKKSKHRSK